MSASKGARAHSGQARRHADGHNKATRVATAARKVRSPVFNVLHIFPSFEFGGQQARFAALAGALGGEFAHRVVSLDDNLSARALIAREVRVTVETLRLRKSGRLHLGNIFQLRSLIKSTKPSVLCTYNWGSIEAAAANRLWLGVPHIHFEDGFAAGEAFDAEPKRRRKARRRLLSKSAVVVPSRGLHDYAASGWSLREPALRFIPNGVDLRRFRQAAEQKERRVRLGAVGALRPEKNHARLIRAFVKADPRSRANLYIIGEGPERDNLTALIEELGAGERITLTGAKAELQKVYRQIDIFALSSDTEQAPLSLMEAMASGLPVVSTRVGDIPDMVSNENSAYITALGDEEAFELALMQMLHNPDARLAIGVANRRKAEALYGLDKMVEAHRRLYLSMAQP